MTENRGEPSSPRAPIHSRRLGALTVAVCALSLAAGPAEAATPRLLKGHAGQPLGVSAIYQAACVNAPAGRCDKWIASGKVVAIDRLANGGIEGFSMRSRDSATNSTIYVAVATEGAEPRENRRLFDWVRPGLALDVRGMWVHSLGRNIKATAILKTGARGLLGRDGI